MCRLNILFTTRFWQLKKIDLFKYNKILNCTYQRYSSVNLFKNLFMHENLNNIKRLHIRKIQKYNGIIG